MIGNYASLKKELTQLLTLIREGQATLEDARQKLTEPIENERKKMKAELESYRHEIELQLEEKRPGLIKLAESYVGSESRKAVIQLAKEKSQGFPWLAQAHADYFHLQDLRLADHLQSKPQPAPKAAEEHRQIAKERREAEKAARIANYLLQYCTYLAPWLDEYIGMESEELV